MTPAGGLRRAGRALLTLLWVFVVCFFLLHAIPGDPLDRLDAAAVPAQQAQRTRAALGLDKPLHEQLGRTLLSYAAGDLGVSFTRKRPVTDVLAETLPATLALGTAALALAYGGGIPLALLAITLTQRRRGRLDRMLLLLATVPRFWLGVMLVLMLHSGAGLFPASHAAPPGGGDWLDRLWHLVLPALTLGLPAACVVARFQIASMESRLGDPHVRLARAIGASRAAVAVRHLLRPSLGPALALLALDLPVLVSGAIVVEVTFAWPGIARAAADAVLASDYPLALAAALLSTVAVIVARLLAEVLAERLDPAQRARREETA